MLSFTEDKTRTKRSEVEREEKWEDFLTHMPFVSLKEGWKFRVTPAFNGAIFRFRIQSPDNNEYSIYFDAYSRLGALKIPYYELYPYNGDVFRSESIDDVIEAMYLEEQNNQ